MYVIIWEYHVKAECADAFEKTYGTTGAWANLFHKQDGYLGTELLRHAKGSKQSSQLTGGLRYEIMSQFYLNGKKNMRY